MSMSGRGGIAALFLSATIALAPAGASASPPTPSLAPGAKVIGNGLTALARPMSGPGAVAIELWIRCPSDGWDSSEPGIARLAAFSAVESGRPGTSVRDRVRDLGGQLSVSVFQTATEIAVLAPPASAGELADALVKSMFSNSIDDTALQAAKARLAEQQAAAAAYSAELLREAAFSALFASGPMRASTFGNADALKTVTLDAVKRFAARSYVTGNAFVAIVGNGDVDALEARLGELAASGGEAASMPPSAPATPSSAPLLLSPAQADVPGVALAWLGPPIADRRAATAMDFLSDYLADARAGTLTAAAQTAHAGTAFEGQFVTLGEAGVFFVSASGSGVDPGSMGAVLRTALAPVLTHGLGKAEFDRAIAAYETRLLRQMDSPQGLADNYGWYFAQGAGAYAPSATDASLGGEYFAAAGSLTPDYVRQIAQQYLGVQPSVISVMPNPVKVNVTSEGR